MRTKEILFSFADIGSECLRVFDGHKIYKKNIDNYQKWRERNKLSSKEAYYLRKKGYLKTDNDFFILTKKGQKRLQELVIEELTIPNEKWDNKWRLVIFDIPEKKKNAREAFRNKIRSMGFESIQESTFCHPFNCLEEVSLLINLYEINPYVTFLETDNIVTSINLTKIFKEKNILKD